MCGSNKGWQKRKGKGENRSNNRRMVDHKWQIPSDLPYDDILHNDS